MRYILILFLFFNICFSDNLKIYEKMYKDEKLKFANEAIPFIIRKNKEILNDRKILLNEVVDEFPNSFMSKNGVIEKLEEQKFNLYNKYLINPNQNKELLIEEVKDKVAPLNLNLILAHMMYESNYGKKDIANKGYNFFNVLTKSKKYDRYYPNTTKEIFYIKYKNIDDSLNHYFELINSYSFGNEYRKIRKTNFNRFDLLPALKSFYPEKTDLHLKGIEYILINDFHLLRSEKNDFNKAKEYSLFVYDKYLKSDIAIQEYNFLNNKNK